jgi:hypothetical protein
VDSLDLRLIPEERMEIRYCRRRPITLAAKSYAGRAFLDWAQYPITETEVLEPPKKATSCISGFALRPGSQRVQQVMADAYWCGSEAG